VSSQKNTRQAFEEALCIGWSVTSLICYRPLSQEGIRHRPLQRAI